MSHAWIEGIAILPPACLALACATPRESVTEGQPAQPAALAEYAGAYQVGADRFAYLQTGNHLQWEAARGTMREMPCLKRFVPGYAETIAEWVLKRTG